MYEYDVFLSYAHEDEDTVRILWQKLCQNGLRVFWSDSNLKANIGTAWLEVIQNSLINSEHFILVCTPNAMCSNWVKEEYQAFFDQCYIKSNKKRRLFILPGENFDTNLLPPFLKNIQITYSIKEVVSLIGGSELQKLRLALEQTQAKLTNLENENVTIKLSFQRLNEELVKEKSEKIKIKKELEELSTSKEQDYHDKIRQLNEKVVRYENEIAEYVRQIDEGKLHIVNLENELKKEKSEKAEIKKELEELLSIKEQNINEIKLLQGQIASYQFTIQDLSFQEVAPLQDKSKNIQSIKSETQAKVVEVIDSNKKISSDTFIQNLITDYNNAVNNKLYEQQFIEKYSPIRFGVAIEKNFTDEYKFKKRDDGEYFAIDFSGSSPHNVMNNNYKIYLVVPCFKLIYLDIFHTIHGIAMLFKTNQFNSKMEYHSIKLIKPSKVNEENSIWRFLEFGELRLENPEPVD